MAPKRLLLLLREHCQYLAMKAGAFCRPLTFHNLACLMTASVHGMKSSPFFPLHNPFCFPPHITLFLLTHGWWALLWYSYEEMKPPELKKECFSPPGKCSKLCTARQAPFPFSPLPQQFQVKLVLSLCRSYGMVARWNVWSLGDLPEFRYLGTKVKPRIQVGFTLLAQCTWNLVSVELKDESNFVTLCLLAILIIVKSSDCFICWDFHQSHLIQLNVLSV